MAPAAVFYDQPQFGVPREIGRVTLDEHGAVQIDPNLEHITSDRVYASLDSSDENLTPEDGERYIRALPVTYRSPYFFCELHDEATGPVTLDQAIKQSRERIAKERGAS